MNRMVPTDQIPEFELSYYLNKAHGYEVKARVLDGPIYAGSTLNFWRKSLETGGSEQLGSFEDDLRFCLYRIEEANLSLNVKRASGMWEVSGFGPGKDGEAIWHTGVDPHLPRLVRNIFLKVKLGSQVALIR